MFGIGSDTIINDTTYYHALRSTGGIEVPQSKYGYIRSEDGKVFYRTRPDRLERIIYDFNILEADTIKVYGLLDRSTDTYNECVLVCDSIRTKTFFESKRMVYYFHDQYVPEYNCESWLEGIGSLSGLLHNTDTKVGMDAFSLSCVTFQGGYLFKKNENEPCIKLAVGIQEHSAGVAEIYPNPINEGQSINIKNAPIGSSFELYDVYGRLVLQNMIKNVNATVNTPLNNGYFLYRIVDKNKMTIQTGQLIIN